MLTYLPQMSPLVPPSASVTRLISMEEECKASAGRIQHAKAAQEPLIVPPNAAASTPPSCISSKRKSNVLFQVVHFYWLRQDYVAHCVFMLHLQAEKERGEGGKVRHRGHIQAK